MAAAMGGTPRELFLHEEIMLIALRDQEGTVPIAASGYPYAIGAAILCELVLRGLITLKETNARTLVTATGSRAALDSPLLAECFRRIRKAPRRTTADRWIVRFASTHKLKHRVAKGLVEKRVLRADTVRFMLAFKVRIYPELDHEPEQAMLERLRQAIFDAAEDVSPRTAALVALTHSAGLLSIPFDKKELRSHKERIIDILRGKIFADADHDAQQQVAIIAATIAATSTAVSPTIS
jgi:hypothetical protein